MLTCFLCHEVEADEGALYTSVPSDALGSVWTPPASVPDDRLVQYAVRGIFNSKEVTYVCAGCLRLRAKFHTIATMEDHKGIVKAKSASEAMDVIKAAIEKAPSVLASYAAKIMTVQLGASNVPERYTEFTEGTSNKFYRVMWSRVNGAWLTYYGRIGKKGTFQSHHAESPAGAKAEAEKKIKGKIKKGYLECPSSAIPPLPKDVATIAESLLGEPVTNSAGLGPGAVLSAKTLQLLDNLSPSPTKAKKKKAEKPKKPKKKQKKKIDKFGVIGKRKFRGGD